MKYDATVYVDQNSKEFLKYHYFVLFLPLSGSAGSNKIVSTSSQSTTSALNTNTGNNDNRNSNPVNSGIPVSEPMDFLLSLFNNHIPLTFDLSKEHWKTYIL